MGVGMGKGFIGMVQGKVTMCSKAYGIFLLYARN